jgi:hypothetical protein
LGGLKVFGEKPGLKPPWHDQGHWGPQSNQVAKLLKRLRAEGKLVKHGERRGSFYTLGENAWLWGLMRVYGAL